MNANFCPVAKLDNVLAATDRSPFSEGAISAAIAFTRQCSSTLSIMTVVETNPAYETAGAEVLEKEKEEAVQYLTSLKARALKELPSCEVIFRHGDSTSRLIVEEAVHKNVDMIVVGKRGRHGLEKVLLGSAAAKVIGHAPCKVLVVPRAATIEFKNILVATDGSEHARAAAAEAIEIARRIGSGLTAISVAATEDEKAKARTHADDAARAAREAGIHVQTAALVGKPHEVIVAAANDRGIDLIVMGAYGRTGLRKLLMGSTTEKVIGLAGCAVLVAKTAKEGTFIRG